MRRFGHRPLFQVLAVLAMSEGNFFGVACTFCREILCTETWTSTKLGHYR